MLPAVGLDQRGPVLGVDLPLPLHVPEVAVPARRGPAVPVDREVLYVDVSLGDVEVGLVLPVTAVAVSTS